MTVAGAHPAGLSQGRGGGGAGQHARASLTRWAIRFPCDPVEIHDSGGEHGCQGAAGAGLCRQGDGRRQRPEIHHEDLASGLIFLGLQGMIDPPRPEAVAAVTICQAAGIQVKMITGDHAADRRGHRQAGRALRTWRSARRDGRCRCSPARNWPSSSDSELIDRAEDTAVFARATPEQKLRLVEALQARGHVVAMTGDGVNDAPALKRADIGVAMGITGTEVAKEAADMVLTDDNFSSIEAAVEEGRGVFDNLTKFIVWTLPTNLGEGLVILAAIFLGVTLPILPVQILWINMTTAGFLGLMLAFEPKEPGIMLRPPRRPDAPILTRQLMIRITLVSMLLLVSAFSLFNLGTASGPTLPRRAPPRSTPLSWSSCSTCSTAAP